MKFSRLTLLFLRKQRSYMQLSYQDIVTSIRREVVIHCADICNLGSSSADRYLFIMREINQKSYVLFVND